MRHVIAVLVGAFLVAGPAFAADAETTMPALVISDVVVADVPAPPPAPNFSTSIEARLRRPSLLPSLYIAAAALQGYDAYSTLSVLKSGGVEANPLMKTVTKSPRGGHLHHGGREDVEERQPPGRHRGDGGVERRHGLRGCEQRPRARTGAVGSGRYYRTLTVAARVRL